MEALRQDDPRHFGPYTVLARFRETASAVQYVVRDTGTGELAVVSAARPALAAVPAFRRRFQAEARTAERLAGGWVQAPLAAPDGGELWTAWPYVPALTLAQAIDLTGPLPERAVRILGAGIAETLSRVHATGAVLQGLAPGTVLLAEDGPRLTAFGPLGAAAAAEARPGGQLSVRLGYLTPEQVGGEEAGPASDLFVLGLLLAYAATGSTPLADGPADEAAERIAHGNPELDCVPDALRELIARCLAKDPSERPSAGSVAADLALEGAAALAGGDWLPEPLSAAVAEQESWARGLKPPADEPPAGETHDAVVQDAVVEDAVVENPVAQNAVVVPVASPVPPEQSGDGGGDAVEDSRTTRFKAIGSRPPHTDRPTTQLAIPREQMALPSAPAPYPYAQSPAPQAAASQSAAPQATAPFHPAPQAPLPLPSQAPAPAPAAPPGPSRPSGLSGVAHDRRALLTVFAAGAAGLFVGAGAVLALGSDDSAPPADDKPAPKPRRPVPGLPPEPRWMYTHPASEPAPLTSAVWQDKLLVLNGENGATGISLRTGRKVWQQTDATGTQEVLAAGKDLCFLAGPAEFLWLSPEDGKIVHRVAYATAFTGAPGLKAAPLAGHSGNVVWFTGSHTVTVKAKKPKKGKKPGKDTQAVRAHLFAYDIVRRKELWRAAVPAGRSPGTPEYQLTAVRADDVVVRQAAATLTPADVKAAKGKGSFRCFDRKTGKPLWTRQFGTVTPDGGASGDEEGQLYAAVGDDLQAFDSATGKPLWTVNGTEGSVFGAPVPAGELLHVTNRNQQVGVVERETGRLRWRRSTEVPLGGSAPSLALSGSGRTLLAADVTQVTAFAATDGRRLWKFQDIGVQDPEKDPKGATSLAPYRVRTSGGTAVVQRGRAFYAFPVT
ncbi:PQQ-binding-like beta-propeller repeat protein [Streptomyces finlayi]|uniref:PQQ-binding-like beta-propeller repeat protein n=1 Tax=Streptomyces finlayi TaxID=67296 RepID=A0A7G7BHZ8_9ACTN|nr:PQQ-binding-like beta-propeller repeat protein [Streptomyces finlayi]QNE74963.1 PQQ-binding-like beta-propeller repeat protein [Streptomyces finlayi]